MQYSYLLSDMCICVTVGCGSASSLPTQQGLDLRVSHHRYDVQVSVAFLVSNVDELSKEATVTACMASVSKADMHS